MRQNNKYTTKQIGLSVKDVDTSQRRVKIALSAFDNIDSDGDIIRRGAFSKSIQERGADSESNRKIQFLRHHDWEHQIGKFLSLEETHDHLIAVAQLGKSTKGTDAFLDYQDGIITEHSIGFNYLEDKMSPVSHEGIEAWEIKEVILWEGSAVTFGANSLTPVLDVSKGNKEEIIKKLNAKMDGLVSALKNGKGTDERLFDIEMGLRVIKQQYNSLIDAKPFVKDAQIDQSKTEAEARETAQKNFYLKLL